MIHRFLSNPSQPWPITTHWTYKNSWVVFGSPMFDAIRGDFKSLEVAVRTKDK